MSMTFSDQQAPLINNLYRCLSAFLCFAPLVGALENQSWKPLWLLSIPVACRLLPTIYGLIKRRKLGHSTFTLVFFIWSLLIVVVTQLGLEPVGGIFGPGGWYLPLAITCIMLSLLKSVGDSRKN